jgi:hypothetical protein
MIMKLSDEQLMAYADGDPSAAAPEIEEKARAGLSVEERQAVEDYRRTRDLVREAFAEDDREPLPADLVAMVLGRQETRDTAGAASATSEVSATMSSAADVIPLRVKAKSTRSLIGIAVALAASIALAFVILPEWRFGDQPPGGATEFVAGPVPAGSALASILERQPSGVPVALDAPATGPRRHVMTVATFRDRNRRICREVELLDAALAPQMVAVACRAPAGGLWSVEGTAVIAQRKPGGPDTFAPAGASEEDALVALRSMLGAREAMSPTEERALLDKGWK